MPILYQNLAEVIVSSTELVEKKISVELESFVCKVMYNGWANGIIDSVYLVESYCSNTTE